MDTMLRTSGLPQQHRARAGRRTKQTLSGFDDLAAELETLSFVRAFLRHLAWWRFVLSVILV
jgi:hypothetical protein